MYCKAERKKSRYPNIIQRQWINGAGLPDISVPRGDTYPPGALVEEANVKIVTLSSGIAHLPENIGTIAGEDRQWSNTERQRIIRWQGQWRNDPAIRTRNFYRIDNQNRPAGGRYNVQYQVGAVSFAQVNCPQIGEQGLTENEFKRGIRNSYNGHVSRIWQMPQQARQNDRRGRRGRTPRRIAGG